MVAYSGPTELLTPGDVRKALGDDAELAGDDLDLAVAATKAYVARLHTTPTTGTPPVVAWPADYKLGAIKLAAGLIRNGFSASIAPDPLDGQTQAALGRVSDIEIEQLLQIGRFAPTVIG